MYTHSTYTVAAFSLEHSLLCLAVVSPAGVSEILLGEENLCKTSRENAPEYVENNQFMYENWFTNTIFLLN